MESWSYVSGGKGFVSNGTISSSDNLAASRNEIVGWDLKSPCGFGNNMLVSGQQAMESQGFGELARQELIEKQLPDTPIRDALSSRLDSGKISDSFAITPNTFSLEDESNSKLSSSVVDSNSKESSFIDLKLGRFGDPRDAPSSGISGGNCVVSSSESCTPPKKARGGVNSHTAHCQVYGCNKDLSSSKEYHKRHKVCEVHSKAPKVIVNGIEQRFCQQCSRFHLLAEFDDCKRSCRKRLAGHNERRRKPQVGIQSGRTGRLVQSYNGYPTSRFHGTASTATSFICQDILPSSLLHSEKYETNDWSRRIKIEDGTGFSSLLAIPITSGQMHSKSIFTSNNFDKVFPAFHDNGANMASGSVFNESSNQYNLDLPGSNSGSRSLLHGACLGNEEFTTFDTASTIQGFSGITDSGCALSLLSSQSQNSPSHSSAIHVVRPLVPQGSNTHYNMAHVSEKLMGVSSSQASASTVLNKYSSLRINSADGNQMSPILISDGAEAVNFGITNGIYQDSHFVNAKDRLSPDNSTTIDLLQLSSQLQRVEHQKQSLLVKQENDAFCCPTVT